MVVVVFVFVICKLHLKLTQSGDQWMREGFEIDYYSSFFKKAKNE